MQTVDLHLVGALGAFHIPWCDADIALTLERVETVMEHWRGVMPGKVLRIPYEHLVQDPESVVRGILEHCKMPWEPAVLDFHTNPRSVSTASLAQVQSLLITQPQVSISVGLTVGVHGQSSPAAVPLGHRATYECWIPS